MRRSATALLFLALGILALACNRPRAGLPGAAFDGDTAMLATLLDAGQPVDGTDPEGVTPLMWAARGGRIEAIRLLAERGADLDREGGVNHWNALAHAVHKGQEASVRALLEAGASVEGKAGATPLAMAAGYAQVAVVRDLLAKGADPRASFPDGTNVLTNAVAGSNDFEAAFAGCDAQAETVKTLLAAAPDLTLPANPWKTLALGKARAHGCDAVIALVSGTERASR